MVREEGIVTGTEKGLAVVEIERHAACRTCGACDKANAATMRISAENGPGASVGDRVALDIEVPDFILAVLLLYFFPAAGLVAGMLAGFAAAPGLGITGRRELFAGMSGIGAMVLVYILASLYGRRRHETYRASIVGVLKGSS